jgi:RES domain-containing protein
VTAYVSLWRIAAETKLYRASDLSGAGAAKNPGRWNQAGDAVIYAATSRALAVLETAAHIDDMGLPLNRFLVRIDVPTSIWAKRIRIDSSKIDPSWRAIPAGQYSANLGHAWYSSNASALMAVPSIIVEEELNILINPGHPDATGLTASVIRLFEYNRIFR